MHQEYTNDNSVDGGIAELFREGLQYYKEGRLQQAQDVCQRIVQKQQYPDALLILGMIAHQQSEFKVAVERYQQYLRIKPNHAQTDHPPRYRTPS